ncbi:ankyrin repeat protein [Deerpox virus W-1170-84]|uniref:Ankyrin repeat protein n=1 Tax=Deerpox virus (strain W-1170-84) TaxID=305676 RepID=Q08F18_DPV84|nr:ankyrin repeat protein [Deerpox virus W-1170-84]
MSSLYAYIAYSKNIKQKTLKFLFKCGYDVNEVYRGNNILLRYLKRHDVEPEIVQLLIDNGADVNYKGLIETPLCAFLNNSEITDIKKYKKILKILLDHDIDINLKTINGISPVVCFIYNSTINNSNILKLLLSKGLNTNEVKNLSGYNILHMYLENPSISKDVIHLLINSGVDILEKTILFHLTPINVYVRNDINNISIDMMKFLIKNGCKIENNNFVLSESVLDSFLDTHKSLHKKEMKILNFILKYIKINIKDKFGFNPLLSSAKYDNYEAFKYLLSLGDDINSVSADGDTCATFAIKHGNISMLNHILGLKPNNSFIKNTFNYFSKNNIDDVFYSSKKYIMMMVLMEYSFTIYPTFYKNCADIIVAYSDFISRCERDLNIMKKELVSKNLSVYDLVFNNKNNIIPFKFLTCKNLTKFKFSVLYGNKINALIYESWQHYEYKNKVNDVLEKYCNKNSYWMKIPIEIRLLILDFLTVNDFKRIIKFDKSILNRFRSQILK